MKKNKNTNYTNLPIIYKGKITEGKQIENIKMKIIIAIFIIFTVILLLFCGYSLAKNIQEVLLKSDTQIIEPIMTVENSPSINITKNNNSGIYSFKIKNYNEENKITETDYQYYIEVFTNLKEGIITELFENEDKINFENNKSEYIKMFKDERQEKEYKLKIVYDENKTDNINGGEELEDIVNQVKLKVYAEQLKA